MEIPIVIVFGYEQTVDHVGWTARRCSRCRRVQAFSCFEKWRTSHVYYIQGKSKNIGQILICNFCETSVGLAATSAESKSLKCSRTWKKEDGLNALVEQTNPALGRVPITDKPGRQELFALLESMNERGSPYKVDSQPGFVEGMLYGAPSFAVLGLLLSLLGLTGLNAVGGALSGGFVGLIAGGTVGAVKFKWDYSKQLVQKMLLASMQRHALPLATLERALKHHPEKLKYVSRGLTQLAADT